MTEETLTGLLLLSFGVNLGFLWSFALISIGGRRIQGYQPTRSIDPSKVTPPKGGSAIQRPPENNVHLESLTDKPVSIKTRFNELGIQFQSQKKVEYGTQHSGGFVLRDLGAEGDLAIFTCCKRGYTHKFHNMPYGEI